MTTEEALEIWMQYKRLRPLKLFTNALEAEQEYVNLEILSSEIKMARWTGNTDPDKEHTFVQRVIRWRDNMTIDILRNGNV